MVEASKDDGVRGIKPRRGRSFDHATVTVIAVGVALWMSWPRAATEVEARVPSRAFISYSEVSDEVSALTRDPLLFVAFARTAMPTLKEDVSEMYSDFVDSKQSVPVHLPQTYGPSSMLDLNSVLQSPGQDLATPYKPQWTGRAAFGITNVVVAPVSIKRSAALKGVALDFPEWKTSFERFSETAWDAVFELSGNGMGRPADIFVIESSGNTELDQWFVRKLYASQARQGAGRWHGQLSISARTE